ncbi:unnamed protein product [Adineta steineri]|uniref:Uncharacterized protein n=2 Tax=Adineta steineri TaxID=433720 RepID=A0A815EIM7_9BILA|nr:unnamed protein product [Adineta steineri]
MCNRNTSLTDPTADFVLSDLLTATEDLIDFTINVFDTIRLQSHFNDRNRRVNLASQLKDAFDAQKTEFGTIEIPIKPCTVTTTLKYDLSLYLDRILQSCKRTKANLMLLRVSRTRSTNTTLLLVASTNVRVEQLDKKVQLLTRLVKENGGEFQTKKKKKKKFLSNTKLDEKTQIKQKTINKQPFTVISKEDLNDYVEITLSFRMIITKYREFIQHIRDASKSTGQASIANSIILIPITANAINELNNILNRLIRIAFAIEAEANSLRQLPNIPIANDSKELYRQNTKDDTKTGSYNPILLKEKSLASHIITKYREFIQHIRDASKSTGQASIANSIILIPITANAIDELNNILNRLIRIAFAIEAEANSLRQLPNIPIANDSKELYRQNTKDDTKTGSYNPILLKEKILASHVTSSQTLEDLTIQKENSSGTNLKRNTYSLLKQNDNRSNIRNQSAITSTSNINSFKLTPNMIANIFEDFFNNTNDLLD